MEKKETINLQKNAYCLLVKKNSIMIQESPNGFTVPTLSDTETLDISPAQLTYVGTLKDLECYSLQCDDTITLADYKFHEISELYGMMEEDLYQLVLRSLHINNWLVKTKYCSNCGQPIQLKFKEYAMKCQACNQSTYPTINPAILVAVVKDRQLLLARSPHFPSGLYSTLAGFVDPGETLEHAVKREVKEEVGINIKNIKYFGTQPWPFSNSIMIGFTAEHDDGDISIDPVEIESAGWYDFDDLPNIPEYNISFAKRIIKSVIEDHK